MSTDLHNLSKNGCTNYYLLLIPFNTFIWLLYELLFEYPPYLKQKVENVGYSKVCFMVQPISENMYARDLMQSLVN